MKINSSLSVDAFSTPVTGNESPSYDEVRACLLRISLKVLFIWWKTDVNLSFLIFHSLVDDEHVFPNEKKVIEILSQYFILVDDNDISLHQLFCLEKKVLNFDNIFNQIEKRYSVNLVDVEKSHFVQGLLYAKQLPMIIFLLEKYRESNSIPIILPTPLLLYLDKCGFLWGKCTQTQDYLSFIFSQLQFLLRAEYYLIFYKNHLFGKDESQHENAFGVYEIPVDHLLEPHIQNEMKIQYGVEYCCWVPGIYSNLGLPIGTGGISVSLKNFGIFIQLRQFLRNRKEIFSLNRQELIIHELVHACRENLASVEFEEEFAYSLSKSFIRRVFAPITQNRIDSILFYIFSLISITTDLPAFPRWVSLFSKLPVLITTLLGLFRLALMKQRLYRAGKYFKDQLQQNNVMPILFRLTDEEIHYFSKQYKKPQPLFNILQSKLKALETLKNNADKHMVDISTATRWLVLNENYFVPNKRSSL
ncbi:hypothetical protein ABK040_007786 [Willaertia magna]